MKVIIVMMIAFSTIPALAAGAAPSPVPPQATPTAEALAKRGNALSLLRLETTPGIEYPLETGMKLFDLGAHLGLRASLPAGRIPWLELGADLGYSYLPVKAQSTLSIGGLLAGPLVRLEIDPRLSVYAFLEGGAYYAFMNARMLGPDGLPYTAQQGGGGMARAGGGLDFYLSPTLSAGVQADYHEYLGLSRGLRVTLGTSFHMDGLSRKVSINNIEATEVFPSLHRSYATAPVARAVVTNGERFPVDQARVGILVKGLMDSPTTIELPGRLSPGQSRTIELPAVVPGRILGLATEGTLPVELRCEYRLNGRKTVATAGFPLRVHGRNAITWNDDRKVATFMDPEAPGILSFAKPLAVMVREGEPRAVDLNLRMGMGIFEGLGALGLGYVIDPNTPSFAESSRNEAAVDFVQYAVQTLAWKGGDCDDLTTLFCSLLEAVGIESAFVTVPGHIYAALPLSISAAEARRTLSTLDDFIERGDRLWVPVEVTLVGQGFLQAWALGAREWREAKAKDQAAFYEVHECWKVWPVAGSPPEVLPAAQAPAAAALERYRGTVAAFVDRELAPREGLLRARIAQAANPTRDWESLGVLYARYGLLDKAEGAFLSALKRGDSLASFVNLATLYRLRSDYAKAREMLAKAEAMNPLDTGVLLGQALVNNLLDNRALARAYYGKLERASPALAKNYSWLGQAAPSDPNRAGDASGLRDNIVWSELE
jgi:hypothetical protein